MIKIYIAGSIDDQVALRAIGDQVWKLGYEVTGTWLNEVNKPFDMDQSTFEFYTKALRTFHHNQSYERADIPFDNVQFHGAPATWDEYMPNWSGVTTAQSTTQGTWVMINSKFFQIKYDAQTNFITTPFVRPENQDAKTALIMWYGSAGVSNRRKHGVLSDINTTLTS